MEQEEPAETAVMVLIAVQAETVETEALAVRLEQLVRHIVIVRIFHIVM